MISQAQKIYEKARGRTRLGGVSTQSLTRVASRPFIGPMSDEIIDLTQYLNRESKEEEPARGAFALWGADGERSRFALPLWRTIYLAQAERGAIVWRDTTGDDVPHAFLVLDRGQDPARLEVDQNAIPVSEDGEPPALHDHGSDGVTIFLGERGDRIWHWVVDGGGTRTGELSAKSREDILFLAGECAGLLFLRDFAGKVP